MALFDSSSLVAVLLSVLSAAGYAVGAVLQERVAAGQVATGERRSVFAAGQWWLALAANGIGAILHAVALSFAPLSLVQPLGVLTLVLALPIAAALGRSITGREWTGAAVAMAGLTVLLVLLDSGGTTQHAPTSIQLVMLALAATALLVSLAGSRANPAGAASPSAPDRAGTRWIGIRLAAASGIASAVASTFTRTALTGTGMLVPQLLLTAGFAAAGLLLSQAAYRHGMGAPLATLTIANPATAVVIGALLLGESPQLSPWGAFAAALATAAAVAGVALLASAGTHDRRSLPTGETPIPAGSTARSTTTANTRPFAGAAQGRALAEQNS